MRELSAELFPTETRVSNEHMIGREQDSLRLKTELSNGVNCVLAAPRRTGKSSLLRAVLDDMQQEGYYTIYLDLWKVNDPGELASALISAAIANRPAPKRLISRLARGWQRLNTSEVEDFINLTVDLDNPTQFTFTPSVQPDQQAFLEYALTLPEQMAKQDGKRIIICLDEFQNIDSLDGKQQNLQKLMVSHFKEFESTSFAFAGSVYSLMDKIFSKSQSPFGNFAGQFRMSKIADSEWRSGLRELFAEDDTDIQQQALDSLLAMSDANPYCTMLVCQQAHLIAVTQDKYVIDPVTVKMGYERAYDRDREKHEQMINRVRALNHGGLALDILIKFCKREKPYSGVKKDYTKISRRIKDLERVGFISKTSEGEWSLPNPLFKECCIREFG